MMHTAFPAYLAGALLILIPVVLHLLKRKVTVPVPFPSFFFLKKTAAGRQRRNSLRKYLILLCRCLAFLFLAYAFAYPHASAVAPAPAEATIVVLDCSFSTEPLQTQMRTALEKVLKAASPEHPMLIAAAGGQLLWSGDFSADRAALASWAQERMSRPQSSAFASALAMVDNRLGTIPAKKKNIVVITDRQALPWEGVRPGMLRHATAIRLAGPSLRRETPNVAVTAAEVAGPYTNARQELLLHVTLRNFNPTPERVLLTVELAQRNVLRKELLLPANGILREQFRLKNDLPDFRPVPGKVAIQAEANELKADDIRYFAAQPVQAPELFLTPHGEDEPDFLSIALTSRADETQPPAVNLHTLTPETEKEAVRSDIMIVDHPERVKGIAGILEKLLASGGSAVLLWRNSAEMRALLGHFGFRVRRSELRGTRRLEFIDFSHRLFRDYLKINAGTWFDILFFRIPQIAPPPDARIIATFDGAIPAVMERKCGKGTLFVLAFPPSPSWTNWQTFGNFPPFWRELILQANKPENFRTTLPLDGSARKMPAEIVDPQTGVSSGRLLRLDRAGNYLCGNRICSVNPPARESETALLPEKFDPSGLLAPQSERKPTEAAAAETELLRAVANVPSSWRFWLLLALLFFLAELGLANRTVL